ncbi:MAG: hypothetical protein KTR31_25820 [Myxococcales bacterium]|nr:hypothetical protein [Myxococcales bacterium]
MLLFFVGACCCCPSSEAPAEPVPGAYLHTLGRWVCEDGSAWQFREDGTYTTRGRHLGEVAGRITGYRADRFVLDGQELWGVSLAQATVSVSPLEGCLSLNGSACMRVDEVPPPGLVGLWEGQRPSDVEEIGPGIFLQRRAPGSGPPVTPDSEVWLTISGAGGDLSQGGRASELRVPQWRTVAQAMRLGEVARIFLDESRPELRDETVFDVGVAALLPPEPGPFWQSVEDEADDAPALQRFSGTPADAPVTEAWGRLVWFYEGHRTQTYSGTFLPVPLHIQPWAKDHLRELTVGSRLRIRHRDRVYDVIVEEADAHPPPPRLEMVPWRHERPRLFVRDDGYAEIWHEGRMKGGLLSAGAEAGVEFCDLPRLPSAFAVDGDVMVWVGGELSRNATHDLERIEAGPPSSGRSGGRPRFPSLGGGGFD